MARAKATVRKMGTFVAAPGQRIGNKNMNRRNAVFKIKTLVPQLKQVEVRRRMKVRRKSHYFSGNRKLRF